jgi:tetratricopeptide (TPR) repeat protein
VRPERWQRFKELLGEGLDHAAEERAAFVSRLPLHDRDLADELERWLALERPSGGFLGAPAAPGASWERAPRLALGPDDRVGRYRVTALVGLGASGVVLEAEQDAPRRRVALKILQRGLASPAAVARFLDEARALALLDHPGVARVLEAGTHRQDGVETPYIAMELVEGARDLLAHARERGSGRDERLALFVELCAAVGHGHARGVIHRDLKPANVLVDRAGRVKVIDFGIARIAGSGERPTAHGDVLGTLAYMSPEQAAGARDALDTRSDVYSLGVLLHELLLGVLPGPEGRGPRPRALDRGLPVDLEAVLQCALDPDPERRYASASALGEDLARFLGHRPVEARPPRFGHHARLLVRRHRGIVAAWAGLVGLAGAAILVVSLHAARSEARERERAQRVTAFLLSLLDGARPSLSGRGDVLLREVVVDAARRVDAELGPLARAEREQLHAALGIALRELGETDAAVAELQSAVALARAAADDGSAPACRLNALGDVLVSAGRGIEAEHVLREAAALEERDGSLPRVYAGITANHLARALLLQRRLDEAAASAARALAIYAGELGPEHASVAAAERTLGDVARARGALDAAERTPARSGRNRCRSRRTACGSASCSPSAVAATRRAPSSSRPSRASARSSRRDIRTSHARPSGSPRCPNPPRHAGGIAGFLAARSVLRSRSAAP